MEKLEDAVKTASAKLGYVPLKEEQLEVITSLLSGRDVFAACQACSLWLMMSRSMTSCAFHGEKRMVRYLPDPFSLFE